MSNRTNPESWKWVAGGATPQTPIMSNEWQRWLTAPNLTGGDLLIELEALRKLNTEGLSTNEVSFLVTHLLSFEFYHPLFFKIAKKWRRIEKK